MPVALASEVDALTVELFTPNLGATIAGVDLRRPVQDAVAGRLQHALQLHGVLFFRNQDLNSAQFLAAAKLFGEPLRHNPYLPSLPEHDGVEIIESGTAGRRILANESWHSDVTWVAPPPQATAIYGAELPAFGGDTVWSSAGDAYDALDPRLAAYLESLTAVNVVDANGHARIDGQDDYLTTLRAKHPPIDVPVIVAHPVTGRKTIFVTELHTLYIKGVSRTTSESLLRLLYGLISDPVRQARFTWEPSTFVIWDNRLVQHRGIHDYGVQRRILWRATLA
jgi:taurine dioxygenase